MYQQDPRVLRCFRAYSRDIIWTALRNLPAENDERSKAVHEHRRKIMRSTLFRQLHIMGSRPYEMKSYQPEVPIRLPLRTAAVSQWTTASQLPDPLVAR